MNKEKNKLISITYISRFFIRGQSFKVIKNNNNKFALIIPDLFFITLFFS